MRKFQIITVFTFVISFASSTIYAQTQPIETTEQDQTAPKNDDETGDNSSSKSNDWQDRIVVGGNLGAQFGASTYVEVSPIVGYKVTDMFTAGVGFTYQYFSQNYNDPTITFDNKGYVYGPRVFLQHDLVYGLFAHVEYEYAWYKFKYEDANLGEFSGAVPALFLGGGYNYYISDNAKFQIMALYDVLHGANSLYYSPLVFRMGINIGL